MGVAIESLFHVLAVDDSIIDRKWIEKLLKTSYFQDLLMITFNYLFIYLFYFWSFDCRFFVVFFGQLLF